MFKLYKIYYDEKHQVVPVNGIYIVYELYEYKFEYNGVVDNEKVFIEDELLDYDNSLLTYTSKGVYSNKKKRLFEDYFGYLTLNINDNNFKFEVRIQKLKVPELEQILLYLWNNNPTVFDNFLSKSTLKSKLVKENQQNFDFSSKFVNIFENFYLFFKRKYFIFKSRPHSLLRVTDRIVDYEDANISDNSIDWLLNNLDELHFDYRFKNAQNSIKIKNEYGIIEKILTEEKKSSYNVYENKIILGAFDYVFIEISKIKEKIKGYVSNEQYYERDFYSIDELRIIPFLRIKDDLSILESKLKSLKNKYKNIFKDCKSHNALPKLTPVFSNKTHYTEAFNKIKIIRNININLDGELSLLNIRKISNLYEKYNLYLLLNLLIESKPLNFKIEKISDKSNQEFNFNFNSFSITLYYDYIIYNKENNTGLQRISKGYYKPDFVLKKDNNNGEFIYYILDSKYSSEKTVKSKHLNECIKKYILDIGISKETTSKVDELILIYPGISEQTIYGNSNFKPKISILPAKVNIHNLKNFVQKITTENGN